MNICRFSMNKTRCFLAIKVENINQYQDRLKSIKNGLNVNIKIVDPNNYHFTLHFFGDLDELDIQKAHKIFNSLIFQKFKFTLKSPGSLPKGKLKHTRVLFITPSKGENDIVQLTTEIRGKLAQEEFKIDKRKILPHLTVCRVRRGTEIENLTHQWLESDFESIEISCSSLQFLKSELTQTGSVYTSMFEYPLIDEM